MNRSIRTACRPGRPLPLIDLAKGEADRPARIGTPTAHEQLRIVALQLFVEHGFQSVSLRQLANALGMQAGSLYNHIESKQTLLFELIEEHETDLLDLLEAKHPSDADGLTRLRTYVELRIRYSLRHPHRVMLARLESRCLDAEQRASIETIRQAHLQHLENILRLLPAPLDAAAGHQTAVARSLVSILEDAPSWCSPNDAHAFEDLITMVTQMVLAACRVPARSHRAWLDRPEPYPTGRRPRSPVASPQC
ncbi:TetR family transcriptional regulator [Stutzerimonas stutzeri]|uniref:TetR family transcriptional regulator n=1 Tax=Stutzerimonas stutzeri TaxID=316 RepID=UPI0015E4309F|nr:TetR/AcrR family transcriptional regulator [Stutzerimonas stutzeri]